MMFPRQHSLRICVLSAGAIVLSLLAGPGARADVITWGGTTVNMPFVNVGNPANTADTTGYGAVGHVYRIGNYAVSRNQWDDVAGAAGITIGVGSPYNLGDQPVNQVSWYAAAQFSNWLTTGDKYTGVYTFTFDDAQNPTEIQGVTIDRDYRNSLGLAYFLPSENEWYKAAYYDPTKGGSGGYWLYPTQQDGTSGVPGSTPADRPMTTTGGTDRYTAVYRDGVSPNPGAPAEVHLAGGPSYYGTVGQGGNVLEWAAVGPGGGNQVYRGGGHSHTEGRLANTDRGVQPPTATYNSVGFRVASVSELLAYEGFVYTGTALDGQDGGYGFSGAWIDSGGDFAHLTDGNLNSPAFPFAPSGRHVSGTGGSANRPLPDIFDFDQDGVLYLSGLFHRPTSDAATSYIWGRDGTTSLFRMGISGDNYPLVGLGGGWERDTGITLEEGETFFLVAKIEASGSADDTISLKVYGENDAIDLMEPNTWNVIHTADITGVFNDLRLQFPGTGRTPAMDEIRIGTTWRSVAVPEPTSLLLLLSLGVAAVAVRPPRRGKRA